MSMTVRDDRDDVKVTHIFHPTVSRLHTAAHTRLPMLLHTYIHTQHTVSHTYCSTYHILM